MAQYEKVKKAVEEPEANIFFLQYFEKTYLGRKLGPSVKKSQIPHWNLEPFRLDPPGGIRDQQRQRRFQQRVGQVPAYKRESVDCPCDIQTGKSLFKK